ncbi:MAG: spermidine/putrescine ABC transporter substrate-binding protein [Anaerolineales bacterium]|nr:spermidine/putrescine ABC transporter substrate-binding protein [Anaerolineales bacterium]
MRIYKYFALLTVLALFLAACGGGVSGGEKVLNLYAWSEYIPQALLDGFNEKTGIKVNYDTYSSNEELLAKLQAGASGYDVIIPSDYTVTIMTNQGMLEPLNKTKISNFDNLDPLVLNKEYDPGNKYTVPYQWGTSCLVVDTAKVSRPITKWADLWDPAFEGKVVLLDDEREVLGMTLTVLGYDKNSIDPMQLEEAKQKFLELMPNVKLFDSDSPKTALLSGEVWLGQTWNGEAALAHQENPDIDYIIPEEGCTVWFDNLAVPKGAPHKDAAMTFINYVLDPSASILITAEFPYSNPNKAALELLKIENPEMYDAYMSFTATNPSSEEMKRLSVIKDVGDATTLWDRVWTEVKGGE